MTTRRRMLQIGAYLAAGSVLPAAFAADAKPKTLLILGGTGFIGPHLTKEALRLGWRVTHFNRGKHSPDGVPNVETLIGDPEPLAAQEIERYSVWPGQACSYMVGKLTWLRLRAKARAALGAKFDIRKFHDAALLNGAMPLAVLESVIDDYIATTKAG